MLPNMKSFSSRLLDEGKFVVVKFEVANFHFVSKLVQNVFYDVNSSIRIEYAQFYFPCTIYTNYD